MHVQITLLWSWMARKFWYWTRETLSVRKGFNLGNFGTGHGKRCRFGKGSIWEILVLDTGNAVGSERVQSGKFWYWTRETLSVRKGFNLGNFGTGHGKRCRFGKGSIWEILVLDTGNAVGSERVQSGKFWYWTRETLSVRKGFNLGNFGTGHGKRCRFGKGSIWEILVLDTGNAVGSERVQSGKFWYWTRETLSVRKGFNLGNFGTGHGKRCRFGKGSIWEIFECTVAFAVLSRKITTQKIRFPFFDDDDCHDVLMLYAWQLRLDHSEAVAKHPTAIGYDFYVTYARKQDGVHYINHWWLVVRRNLTTNTTDTILTCSLTYNGHEMESKPHLTVSGKAQNVDNFVSWVGTNVHFAERWVHGAWYTLQ